MRATGIGDDGIGIGASITAGLDPEPGRVEVEPSSPAPQGRERRHPSPGAFGLLQQQRVEQAHAAVAADNDASGAAKDRSAAAAMTDRIHRFTKRNPRTKRAFGNGAYSISKSRRGRRDPGINASSCSCPPSAARNSSGGVAAFRGTSSRVDDGHHHRVIVRYADGRSAA
jgi:hypothetical protein